MSAPDRLRLRLYVAGPSPRSTRTIDSIRRLCDGPLAGACDLEIVDLYQQPGLAAEDGIVAAPTLLRLSPLPARRVAGDLTDERRVLATLGLDPAGAGALSAEVVAGSAKESASQQEPGDVSRSDRIGHGSDPLQAAQQQQQQDAGIGGPDA